MKNTHLIVLIILLSGLINLQALSQTPADSVKGNYVFHAVRYSEERYNEKSGATSWHSLLFPDTTLTIKLSLNWNDQFIEQHYGSGTVSMFGYKNKGCFFELSGTWSFTNDTLLLIYTGESTYKEKDKSTLIETVDLAKSHPNRIGRSKSFVFTNSSRLCKVTKDYGTYCLDKK